MPDSNLRQLIDAAQLLRPLLHELVFVGGSVTGLLITDQAAGAPRTTFDVDAIAEITSYAQYVEFGERLRALGFAEDTSVGAPVNFDWGTGSAYPLISPDNFMVRWHGKVQPFYSQTYTFTTRTDDGARLW